MFDRKIKVYVVGYAKDYASFLFDYEQVNDIKDAELVIFTGGEDVDPEMYNMKKHPTTFCNIRRDLAEKAVFDSIRHDQLVVGICRGSQFLCVMNGGILIQDLQNHAMAGTHEITNEKGEIFKITSTHHQAQCPYWMNPEYYKLLFWASPKRSYKYAGFCPEGQMWKHWNDEWQEPEIVEYHVPGKPVCIGIQGHPEIMDKDSDTVKMLNNLIRSYLK